MLRLPCEMCGVDEQKAHGADVQKATDDVVNGIDTALKQKSEEIMQV